MWSYLINAYLLPISSDFLLQSQPLFHSLNILHFLSYPHFSFNPPPLSERPTHFYPFTSYLYFKTQVQAHFLLL